MTTAQVERVRRRYRWLAPVFDWLGPAWLERARARAVELLGLQPGETVLDLGCGTGRSLPMIEAAIGRGGRLVGVDASADMLARARQRVDDHGWRNVTLIQADAEDLTLEARVDAVLCFCTHDILTSPAAMARAVAQLRPGGRIVAAGVQHPDRRAGWLAVPGLFVSAKVFSVGGTRRDRPWRELELLLPGTHLVEARRAGAFYLVKGVC
jgi:ubiquinone/menaquinone biosynthesis C-methylase UbiE